jgi:Zn-dependent protease/predicted transcriptional regulator
MLGGVPIGKAFGISLRLHWSWFIIFVLVTWALAANYFPVTYPNWTLSTKIIAGIITSLLFFGSVLAHELMHSIVAIREGMHIDAITLFILGGVSQMTEEPKNAKDEFRMAIAGPGTSLIIGAILILIFITLGGKLTWATFIGVNATIPGTSGFAAQFFGAIALWLGYINLALGVFNLIPGYPLDGGRVLRSLIWWSSGKVQNATRIAATIGRVIGYLFILGGIYFIFTGLWFNGIWLALIGWFLESAASGSYRQMIIQDMLRGHSASEIMSTDCYIVAPDLTVEKLVNENIMVSGRRCFPVVSDGRVQGMITLRDIQKVPQQQWRYKLVRDAMTVIDKIKAIKPDEDLSTVMNTLSQNDVNQLPVIENNNIIGMVARENIINFINIRAQLNKRK